MEQEEGRELILSACKEILKAMPVIFGPAVME
jgi:hypothetical protein